MPTLYDYEVEVDTTVNVDIDLTLSDIAAMLEDEMEEFLCAHASNSDMVRALQQNGCEDEMFEAIMDEWKPATLVDALNDLAPQYHEAIMEWAIARAPKPEPEPLLYAPQYLTAEELKHLEVVRRAVSTLEHAYWMEHVIAHNWAASQINPWKDALTTLDSLMARMTAPATEADEHKTDDTTNPEA
jgi:hypothetical protein